MNKQALEYFKNGFSCSESIIKAAIDEGLVSKELLPVATSFSGGMGSGCLCGAVAGAQMVIGAIHGKDEKKRDGLKARELAKKIIEDFKEKNKYTCCKALTSGFDFSSPERRRHCAKMVEDCGLILEAIFEKDKQKV